ncbi:unnamed protein product [Didymodactylos carnosus]|uniref:Integrase catalytic domain-containing protein n=1 Tax=Didymodactylos carnosus TaxID=1234261 RepID=A0A814SFL2_9BILA|nr:unnamed protein product [Didymodactylos carnosus]CAF3907919.1 unnamed protein product [Didymodactylos carnosus]
MDLVLRAIVWGTQHFRPYIEGRPFKVWTDHRSLQWLRNIKDPTSRLARWAIKLDAYNMVIKQHPGKVNSNIDALSRYPLKSEVVAVLQTNGIFIGPLEENQEVSVNLWDHCNILDDIKLAQCRDKNYSPLISFIQDDIQPDDEVLHRKLENLAKIHRVINGKILKLAHDHSISDHFGRRKILHRISIRFFWEGGIKSKKIAQVLHDEVICRHGVPVKIVSYNGAQFVAEIFRETLKIMGIRHRTTALYHPQSNLSERVNRTPKPMLAIFAQNETPAFLMYDRELKLPLDLMYGPEVDVLDELRSYGEVRSYTERLTAILESAHESAKENLEIARENQKSSYDLHRKNVQFAVGEKVLMANTAGSALDYELISEDDGAVLSPIHVERLRPYHEQSFLI